MRDRSVGNQQIETRLQSIVSGFLEFVEQTGGFSVMPIPLESAATDPAEAPLTSLLLCSMAISDCGEKLVGEWTPLHGKEFSGIDVTATEKLSENAVDVQPETPPFWQGFKCTLRVHLLFLNEVTAR